MYSWALSKTSVDLILNLTTSIKRSWRRTSRPPLTRRLPAVEAHLPDDVVNLFDDLLHNDRCGAASYGLKKFRKRCLAAFLAWLAGEEVTLQAFR